MKPWELLVKFFWNLPACVLANCLERLKSLNGTLKASTCCHSDTAPTSQHLPTSVSRSFHVLEANFEFSSDSSGITYLGGMASKQEVGRSSPTQKQQIRKLHTVLNVKIITATALKSAENTIKNTWVMYSLR